MKKIILIGCSGVLGKYFLKNLKKNSDILVAADIKIKKNFSSKKLVLNKINIENENEIENFLKQIKRKFKNF